MIENVSIYDCSSDDISISGLFLLSPENFSTYIPYVCTYVNVAVVLQTYLHKFHVKEIILFLSRMVNDDIDTFETGIV